MDRETLECLAEASARGLFSEAKHRRGPDGKFIDSATEHSYGLFKKENRQSGYKGDLSRDQFIKTMKHHADFVARKAANAAAYKPPPPPPPPARKPPGIVHRDGRYTIKRNAAGSYDPAHKGEDLSDRVSYVNVEAAKQRIEQHRGATSGGSGSGSADSEQAQALSRRLGRGALPTVSEIRKLSPEAQTAFLAAAADRAQRAVYGHNSEFRRMDSYVRRLKKAGLKVPSVPNTPPPGFQD